MGLPQSQVGYLIVELNKRIQEEDEREIKLEEKYTLISQTENRLESLKEEIKQLKDSMQALTQKEEPNTMDPATINRYLEMFKNLDPDQISLILDSKTNEEIGLIWASMKEGDIAELMKYWATERPNEKDRFKIIMEAYEKPLRHNLSVLEKHSAWMPEPDTDVMKENLLSNTTMSTIQNDPVDKRSTPESNLPVIRIKRP